MDLINATLVQKGKVVGGCIPDNTASLGNKETVGSACVKSGGYAVDDYFVDKATGLFYVVTATINQGDTITAGTNCSQTNIGNELSKINSDLSELVVPFVDTASTPLYSFTDGANAYTATENCILIGNHLWPSSDGNSLIMLDGVTVSVAKRTANSNIYTDSFIYIPIKAGQVITTSSNFRYNGGGSPLYIRKILN